MPSGAGRGPVASGLASLTFFVLPPQNIQRKRHDVSRKTEKESAFHSLDRCADTDSSLTCARNMDLDDLYGDLDAAPKQLPSAIELRGRLTEVVNEREALEAQLQALQSEERASRAALRDLMHRACVLLATARLELQRKDKQLNEYGITVPAK